MMSGMTVPASIYEMVGKALQDNWRDDDWFACDGKVINHYAAKAAVCAKFSPRRIIEIGTRCGYSVLSFASVAPRASFLCLDGAMDDDSYSCLSHWKRTMERRNIEADLIVVDSHAVKSLPRACFAHVDGDHTYEGALADLRLVQHCRAILADDCDNPEVKAAVEQFCRETARLAAFYHDGLRGAAVIT